MANKIGPDNPGSRGRGRPKGSQNKITRALKDMILDALANAGGTDYLEQQSRDNPTAFLTLVGKVLPLQVTGPNDGPVQIVTDIKLIDGDGDNSAPA